MSIVISADEIKVGLPDYSPGRAEEFHHESASRADKLFTQTLKDNPCTNVILLNGGTASGKTEFLSTHLSKTDSIILDATLSTELGAKNKIRQIIKAGKTVKIYSVIPGDLKRAFLAFLNRDRKFSDTYFYKTHSGARKTLLWIANEYSDTEINIVESSYNTEGKLHFVQIHLDTRQKLMDFLKEKQMSEDDIIRYIDFIK